MKKLYLIGGTMGVGKTTVCQALKRMLPACVFLDGDWCWDMHPFVVNEMTKAVVTDNIRHCLRNFIKCGAYENIIFCWVMHEQAIIDSLIAGLDVSDCEVICVSLIANEPSLRKRLTVDVNAGIREADVIQRSVARIPLYQALNTIHIDVSDIDAAQAARVIAEL